MGLLICCRCSVTLFSIDNLEQAKESFVHFSAVVLRIAVAGDNMFVSTEADTPDAAGSGRPTYDKPEGY